jgi:hypothetical protein
MKRSMIFFFVLILATACAALAHDGKKHILGTVTKVDPDLIVVATKDHKTIEVKVVPSTVFLMEGKAAKLQDIALGDRVAIHATSKGGGWEADEVQIGTAPVKGKPKR